MFFACNVRLTQTAGDLVLRRPRRNERDLALDDGGIRFEPRLYGCYRIAKRALSIDQRLIAEQELG